MVSAITRAEALPSIYEAALDAIQAGLDADRGSVLFADADGVMRFKAWRHLSEGYRQAVEGHSPWRLDDPDPRPVCVDDLGEAALSEHLREVVEREGIGALAFIPVISERRLLGKFMVYYNAPHAFTETEVRLAQTIAAQIAFAVTRQRGEEALRRSEERYRLLVEQASDGIFVSDARGRYVDVNSAGCEMLGYTREEILQRTIADVVAPEEVPRIESEIARLGGGKVTCNEWRFQRKDGSIFPGEVVGRQLPDGRLQGILRDITKRKRAEEALQAQNRRLVFLNQAACVLLSDHPEEVVQKLYQQVAGFFHADAFFEFLTSEDREELRLHSCGGVAEETRRKMERLDFGQAICGTVAQNKEPIYAHHIQQSDDPKARLAKDLGFRTYACNPLLVGDRLVGTLSFASRQRDNFTEEDLSFFQTIAHFVAIARERARLVAELREDAKRLEQTVAERTAKLQELVGELEHFSYTITHDLRAPLRAMRGFGTLLLEQCADEPTRRDFTRRIVDAASRMDRLITDALDYSKVVRQAMPLERVDAGALLRGIIESYPQFQPPQAVIQIDGPLPVVLGNEAALTQCFSNLLGNAVKFVETGKMPQVRVWAELREHGGLKIEDDGKERSNQENLEHPTLNIEPRNGASTPSLNPQLSTLNSYARFWIEDNGIGIRQDSLDRIFVMFQRATKEYEGTGIGLALVKKVIERMGGKVGVESQVGVGSRFWVELREC